MTMRARLLACHSARIPRRAIFHRVIEIDEKRRVWLELARDLVDGALRIGHVMQHAEREGEIERAVRQRDGAERSHGGTSHCWRARRLPRATSSASALASSRCRWPTRGATFDRPAAAAAAGIEADSVLRQRGPRKDAEIVVEDGVMVRRAEIVAVLAERAPFVAESFGDTAVDILHRRLGHVL